MTGEQLMASLAETLPGTVPADRLAITWDRSFGDRLAGRRGRPVSVSLDGPGIRLALREDGARSVAEVIREVRGVVISRQQVPVAQWLEVLGAQLRALAAQQASDAAAVARTLAALGVREPGSDLVVDDADLTGGLESLPVRLAGRLPEDLVATVQRICVNLLQTLPRLSSDPAETHTVRRTCTEYLPGTLRAYLALPPDWAASHDLGGGRTALDDLRGQLDVLETGTRKMLDAALATDARSLAANGMFLDEKFGASPLDYD